jgi:2-oxoglutarate dehydrogenase E2 component (dihydrolipoamide succinyltransferase)
MAIVDIKVPVLPESVSDATIVTWHKNLGDSVQPGESLFDLETDKSIIEVPAPVGGRLASIAQQAGAVVTAGAVVATLDTEATPNMSNTAAAASSPAVLETATDQSVAAGPAARREAGLQNISLETVQGTGKSGRVTREDIVQQAQRPQDGAAGPTGITSTAIVSHNGHREKRVPMSRLRVNIAKRLVQAQQQAALLTTFNVVDMSKIMESRKDYKEIFEKKYGIKLGFMSFFVKAVIEALKRYPVVNAAVDASDIVYYEDYHIGIAVSTDRGLVVPVIRSADTLSFAEIESTIIHYGKKAREGKLMPEDLMGGTFTITNGGVFGSLLSTPIVNPPQSAILGMHKIEERPVVEKGQIVIRPMMYLALSYDHRIIDGKDSVGFLVTVKQLLEDPARLLLQV